MRFFRRKKANLAQPQTIFARITNLMRANIHAALDAAEDPEKALDLFVLDFTTNIADAETAVAETIGSLRLLEKDYRDTQASVDSWGAKALAAANRANTHRAQGDAAGVERYERLAAQAVRKQLAAEDRVHALTPQIEEQTAVVDQLKNGLSTMRERLSELKDKRNEMVARTRTVDAQERMVTAVSAVNSADPTQQIGRFEDSLSRREATVRGRAEIAAASMDAQFDELTSLDAEDRVQARLAQLTQRATAKQLEGS